MDKKHFTKRTGYPSSVFILTLMAFCNEYFLPHMALSQWIKWNSISFYRHTNFYYSFVKHGLCNAHTIRELTSAHQEFKHYELRYESLRVMRIYHSAFVLSMFKIVHDFFNINCYQQYS